MTRPLRSQPTRDRILIAARLVFSQQGYDRATVRAVAAEAATNPSLIIRYFGSKEGLFAAAIDFDLRLPDLAGIAPDERGRRLVAHFLDRWETASDGGDLAALLRAAVSHPAARARMADTFETQLLAALAHGLGRERAALAAPLIASQMLGLALTRYVLAFPAVAGLGRETLVRAVGATIQGYLTLEPMT